MADRRGEHFVFYIEDSASPGAYNKLGSARANTMTRNGEIVDVSDKGSGAFRKLLSGGGIRSISMSASGPFDGDEQPDEDIRAASESQVLINVQVRSGAPGFEDIWQFSAQIPTYERSGDYNTEERFSVTFESSGTIIYTPGA